MEINERLLIDVPVDEAWRILRDPEKLALCFPGASLGEVVEGTAVGSVTVQFGPTSVTFNGSADFAIDDATRTAVISARGADRGSSRAGTRASATADIKVIEAGDGSEVLVDGSIEMIGPLAGFAETGGVYVAQALFRQVARNVEAQFSGSAPGERQRALSGFRLAWAALASWFRAVWRRVTGRRSDDLRQANRS